MFRATQEIEAAFKNNDWKCTPVDLGKISYVEAGFNGDNCTVKVRFISTDDDNDAKILTDNIAVIPASKRDSARVLLCELNSTYRYVKFTLDSDNAITASYDLPLNMSRECLGAVAIEMATRFLSIVDDAYPQIMRMLWAG